VSEQFLNGTSAHIRLFSAIHSISAVPHVILTALHVLTASDQQNRYKNWPMYDIPSSGATWDSRVTWDKNKV